MVIPYMMVILPKSFGVSAAMAAFLVFVVKFSVKASNFIVGPVADKLGTKKLMIVGMLLRGAGMAAFAVSQNVVWLMVCSLIAGIGNGLYSPPTRAALSALTPPDEQRSVFALRAVAANLGMALAPATMLILAFADVRMVFLGSGILYGVFALIAWKILPELPVQSEESMTQILKAVWQDKPWVTFCLLVAGSWFLYGQVDSNVVVWADELGGMSWMAGISTLFAITVAALQLATARMRFMKQLHVDHFIIYGTLTMTAGLLIASVWNAIPGAIATVVFIAIGATLLAPGSDLVTVDMAKKHRENSYFAAASLASALGTSLSAPVGRFVIQRFDNHFVAWGTMALIGIVITVLLVLWSRRRNVAVSEGEVICSSIKS
jgi:DHA1 family multidrug resistance protein-like MFS transporter